MYEFAAGIAVKSICVAAAACRAGMVDCAGAWNSSHGPPARTGGAAQQPFDRPVDLVAQTSAYPRGRFATVRPIGDQLPSA